MIGNPKSSRSFAEQGRDPEEIRGSSDGGDGKIEATGILWVEEAWAGLVTCK